MKKYIRIVAAALCGALVFSLCGCSPSPAAVIVNGNSVDASELAFYLEYNRINLGNKYGYVSDGNYDAQITEQTKQDALSQIITAEIVREKCREFKLKISKEDLDELAQNKADIISGQGGKAGYLKFLDENAMTDRMYDKFQENAKYYDLLFEHLVGKNGEHKLTDEALRKFFGENYVRLQYIRFSTVGDDGKPLAESEADAQMKKATEVLSQARALGSDFTALLLANNDDAYMNDTPDGVVTSSIDSASQPQFKDLFTLKDGEIAGILTGFDGYYIIKKLTLDAGYFDTNREQIERTATEWQFNTLLDGWVKSSKVKTTSLYNDMNLTNLRNYIK